MADEQLLTMQLPHSTQAEQAVLGSMLIDADCIKDVMDKLQASDFYLRTNREIFETIYQMFVYSKPIDGVTVAGELEKAGLYTDATRSYLVQLMEVTPTSANVMEYVRIVQDKASCARWPLPPPASPPWSGRAPAPPAICWSPPSRRSTPSAAAAAARAWSPWVWCWAT